MHISKEGQDFLDNLRVYLISSGKKEAEINEIIEELEDHLYEAEKNGKNIDDIIGKSPKEYMNQVASEMSLDLKGLVKYVPIIIIGAIAFILTGKAIRGILEFSIIELVGYPLIFLLSLFTTAIVFRYVSSRHLSKITEWFLFGITGVLPVLLFLILIYTNDAINSPSFVFGVIGNIVAIGFAAIIFISLAIWSKSSTLIMIPILLFLPEVVINLTTLQVQTKAILYAIVPFALIGIYLLIYLNIERITSGKQGVHK